MNERPFSNSTRITYYALAAFIMLTIVVSAYLILQLERSDQAALQLTESGALLVSKLTALEHAAGAVDAPANDLFLSNDVLTERARLRVAVDAFWKASEQIHGVMKGDPRALTELKDVDSSISPVVAESERVFALYEQGNLKAAAAAGAQMDRLYARFRESLGVLRSHLRQIQIEDLRMESQRVHSLERGHTVILGLMAVLVVGLFGYGRLLDREVLTSGEREQYVASLQKGKEELRQLVAERDASAEILTQQKHLLTQAQRIAGLGVFQWEIAANRVWWSEEMHRLFGVDPQSFVPTLENFLQHVIPADRTRVAQAIEQAVARHEVFDLEYQIVLADGQTRVQRSSARVETDGAATAVAMLGVVQDITEQKWAEEQLLRQEAQLAEAQRIARSGSWELNVETGEVSWSDELHEILGYASGEVKPSFKAYMDLLPADERKRVYGLLKNAMMSGERVDFEHSLIRRDGAPVCMLVQAAVTRDSQNRPVRVLGVSQDVTARKKAELDLRTSEERFSLASRATSDVIWDWNIVTDSVWVSEGFSSRLGYPTWGEMDIQVWHAGVHPDDIAQVDESIKAVIDGSASDWSAVHRYRHFGGEWRDVLDRCYIMRDASGKAVRAIGAMMDITERRATERLKDEFISTVSHELRTPLTSIRGALGLLSSGRLGRLEEKGQRLLEIAATNTDRLVRLINDILDIERIESGKVTLVRANCDAAEIVRQAADIVRPLADRENISIVIDAQPTILIADPDRMMQTLTNLIGNAVKFSPAGSAIRVKARREEQNVVFSVADEGRGIPAEKLATIFERFQQVDASDSRDKGGSGLGLAICRSIVRQHGGEIRVDSRVGEGSTFVVTIPAGVTQPVEFAETAEAIRLVYVCDDDSDSRAVLRFFLDERGYAVKEMASGRDLLHAIADRKPDAILLDLFMPDMNGWETLARIQSDPETSDIPVIVVSVLSPDETGSTGLDLSGWVQKPLEERTLAGAVDRAFGKSRRRQRLMLVEDDEDLASIIIASFDRYGIETIHARSGKEAIEMARRVEPDLLILDLVLPDLDGYAIVDWLKDHDVWRGLPMVVYSATEPSPSQRDRLRLGHTEFLTKSRVAPDEFERRIVALLDTLIDGSGGPASHVA